MRSAFVQVSVCLLTLMAVREAPTLQSDKEGLNWIWYPEGDPLQAAPTAKRYFRKVFTIDRPFTPPTDEALLDITADNEFKVWINGHFVGEGKDWHRVHRFDVNKWTVAGKNVLAVEANNTGSAAGLLVRFGFIPNGQSRLAVLSDGSWKSAMEAQGNWQHVEFDDQAWRPARVLGLYGQTGPWRNLTWDSGGNERFTVPKGFVVEEVVSPNPNPSHLNPKLPFSLINMCFDARGRLLVSQERGPVLLCTKPNKNSVMQSVKPYCDKVNSCQGMCWVRDALLLVGDGPQGTGLYRVRDLDGDDKAEEVKLIHRFRGGMGEHGPHAIIHGPDDWLYLVIGNHAWAQPRSLAANSPLTRWPTGQNGKPQGHPESTEDILLPRLEDARGHAVGIHAPGGTIWRFDHQGENFSLVAAGFRNHYDAAFNRQNELFTFDSDMEWDEALPWYRPVRVLHCPPGADFVWRNGAGNTPNYYIDSLPPMCETGRGSPVGVEAYDHTAFPSQYRGALFLADWAAGVIFAVMPQRADSSFLGKAERFCEGIPMNVTDLAVGPEGALYFTLGGRGTAGGVYRIVSKAGPAIGNLLGGLMQSGSNKKTDQALQVPQPLAAFSREQIRQLRKAIDDQTWKTELTQVVHTRFQNVFNRLRALDLLQEYGPKPTAELLCQLAYDDEAEDGDHPFIRAHAVYLLGLNGYAEGRKQVIDALKDSFPLVRRRACEAVIRAGYAVNADDVWYLLADQDQYVRTAARLVLERIPPQDWIDKLRDERSDVIAMQAIVALTKTGQARKHGDLIIKRLARMQARDDAEALLDQLRTWQLVCLHCDVQRFEPQVRPVLEKFASLFPHTNMDVSRELAILLTHSCKVGLYGSTFHRKLLEALQKTEDRAQQIHFFYCLRLLDKGWSQEDKEGFCKWFESTQNWRGGFSFTPFLENIFRDMQPVFTASDRVRMLDQRKQYPHVLQVLLNTSNNQQLPAADALLNLYENLLGEQQAQSDQLRGLIIQLLGRKVGDSTAQGALRRIAELDPRQRDQVARSLALVPRPENWPILVDALTSSSAVVKLQSIRALQRIAREPKQDDPKPYRLVLLASRQLNPGDRWEAVKLLRKWGKKQFTAEEGDWITELTAWSTWFGQTFPMEPALPNAVALTATSKWKMEELLKELDQMSTKGDIANGKRVFEKANCLKCHKFGSIGEGIGPDLTTLKSRFKRADLLESLLYPSKVVSDQYRGSTVLTKQGQILTGLVAVQDKQLIILQADGNKATVQKNEVESMVNTTASTMPEQLLDALTLQEIRDLFAYLESEPPK